MFNLDPIFVLFIFFNIQYNVTVIQYICDDLKNLELIKNILFRIENTLILCVWKTKQMTYFHGFQCTVQLFNCKQLALFPYELCTTGYVTHS